MCAGRETTCPMDSILRLLMGPWTSYILWILESEGPQRFNALRRAVRGVSTKVLTERLRMLEKNGLILRAHEPTIPPKVTYSLSPRGHELRSALRSLHETALRWRAEDAREDAQAER